MPTTEAVTVHHEVVDLPQQMQQEGDACRNQITGMRVTNLEERQLALDLSGEIKGRLKALDEHFTPIKRSIDAAKRVVLDSEKRARAPYEAALAHLDGQLTSFRREEQRIADLKRKEAEEKQMAEIRKQREKEAAEATARGKNKLAEAIKAAPIDVPKVEVPVSDWSGTRKSVNYKFRFTNMEDIPREFMMPDQVKIGEHIRREKQNALPGGKAAIPGVEAFTEEHVRPI